MFLAMLALAPPARPTEPLAGQLRAAIWYDLQVNAMIGNGNWIASLWYNAGSEDPKAPNLHIQDLGCSSRTNGYLCSFTLFRAGGVTTTDRGEQVPDTLICNATFIRANGEEGWAIKHIPTRRVGHSQTTMKCNSTTA